jgi:hypothetical protein
MDDNPYQAPQAVTCDRPLPLPAGWWRATIAMLLFLSYGLLRDSDFVVPAVLVLAILGISALVGPPQEKAVPNPATSVPLRLSNAAFLIAALCCLALPLAMLNNPDWSLYQPPLVYISNALLALIAIHFGLWLFSKFVRHVG